MSYQTVLERARLQLAKYYQEEGVLCTVKGLTYDEDDNLWLPPYVLRAEGIYCSIASLASIHDPRVADYVRSMNISFELYRRITCAYDTHNFYANDLIIKEPATLDSDAYVVVEVVQSDETSPMNRIMHCRKTGLTLGELQ